MQGMNVFTHSITSLRDIATCATWKLEPRDVVLIEFWILEVWILELEPPQIWSWQISDSASYASNPRTLN